MKVIKLKYKTQEFQFFPNQIGEKERILMIKINKIHKYYLASNININKKV